MEKSSYNTPNPDAYRLLESIHKMDDIRINKWEIPFLREVSLFDFSIQLKGDQEDRVYLKDPFMRSNIRRGNTIIQIVDNKTNELKSTFFGRKGLKKFFDIREEYLEMQFSEEKFEKCSFFSPAEHFKLNNLIFQDVRESLREGHEIEVFKLLKANGENCQISWVDSVQTWLIASKNVSLLARNAEDIEEYLKDRFYFAKLIAKAWFSILERISRKGVDVNLLKGFLKRYTLIGEYVGNHDCQHLVPYRDIDILFFAIVNNHSDEECLSPLESFSIFSRFQLSTVRIEDLGVFKDVPSLNLALRLIYSKIATADLELEQEGSVFYFYNTITKKVLSLGKIKTLEYQIFRKLREKLKNFVQYYEKLKFEPFQSFYNEVEELCKKHEPPRPLDFYYKICQFSIDFIDEYPQQAYDFHKKFITFLLNVLHCITYEIPLTPKDLDRELNPSKPLFAYSTEPILKYHFKNSTKTHIYQESLDLVKRKLFVIVPIMIPGSGKSFMLPFMHEAAIREGAAFEAVCADKIRRECMNTLAQKNPSLSEERLFEQTGKIATVRLTKVIEEQIKTLRNSNKENNFLFIDKNHCPGTFEKVVDNLQKICKDWDLHVIALHPKVGNLWGRYPFSFNYFMNCVYRVQNRVEHETLRGNHEKSLNVMFMYLQLFRDSKLNEEELKKKGFDRSLSVDLTMENKEVKIEKKMVALIEKALEKTEMRKKCDDIQLVKEISRAIENSHIEFPIPKKQYLIDLAKSLIKEILIERSISISDKSRLKKRKASVDLQQVKEIYIEEEKREIKEYNPRSMPSILAIFAKEQNRIKREILDNIRNNLTFLRTNFPDDKSIENNLNSLTKTFVFPRSFNVATLSINGDKSKTETHAFKAFKEGVKVKLELPAILFIPDMIIIGLYFYNKGGFPVFGVSFPHMILMMSDKTNTDFAVKVLNTLFEGNLKLIYEERNFLKEKLFCCKTDVVVDKKKYQAYLTKVETGIAFDGETVAVLDSKGGAREKN